MISGGRWWGCLFCRQEIRRVVSRSRRVIALPVSGREYKHIQNYTGLWTPEGHYRTVDNRPIGL
jgi:hypothetical protein